MMKAIAFLYFASAILFAASAGAQWTSDTTVNTAVCTATGSQQNPQACSDESNGIIIVWEDFRSGHDWDIYAQKLNGSGVAQWAKNGINICTSVANQTSPVIVSDGNGGAYVAWKDTRNTRTDIYAQHINSDGSLAYGASGTAIGSAPNVVSPDNLSICSDNFGSAYVAWQDSRTSITPSSSRPDIYMNRLTGGGAAWGGGGSSIISETLMQTNPQVTADGTGGCYLVWVHHGVPAASICGNRVNAGGGLSWGSSGEQIFGVTTGSSDASRNPKITHDGSQLCLAFEQVNSTDASKGWNILANRVASDGSLIWGTSTTAPEISTDWIGDQINPVVFPDDSTDASNTGGLLVVYENYFSTHDIVITRLMPDGNALRPSYPNQLYSVCSQPNDQTLPKAVKTGSGEVLIVWNDMRSGSYSSIYAQRCDRTPKRFLGTAGSTWGVPVSNRVNSNADEVQLVARTNGGIAVWRDNRNGASNTDIYAQLIFRDGSLPVELENFSVSAHSGAVLLNWQTASEKDNAGFEIERRLISNSIYQNSFEVVGSYLTTSSLRGSGFSYSTRVYSYIDQPGKSGIYEYRLVDYSLDGERTNHEPKTVEVSDVSSGNFSVGQNSPNPFSDKTIIPVTLSSDAMVTIRICDILGRLITTPYNNSLLSAGSHELRIDGAELKNSGSYYCIITITDPQTGENIYTGRQSLIVSR